MTSNPHWIYLETLRRSGATNMYGAVPHLAAEFGLGYDVALHILADWMDKYDPKDYAFLDGNPDRVCAVCGKHMTEGFCILDGEAYYCSEDCLYSVMTEQEYIDLYEADEAYWTEWEG